MRWSCFYTTIYFFISCIEFFVFSNRHSKAKDYHLYYLTRLKLRVPSNDRIEFQP